MSKRRFEHSNNPAFPAGSDAILVPFGRRSYLAAAAQKLGGRERDLGETTDRIVYDVDTPRGSLTLAYSGMGGPATANALEMLAANGVSRVVLFGACGGVTPEVAVGDLIVATGAVRGEGTSGYYAPNSYPAACDPSLVIELWERASKVAGRGAHRGVVYTTDASYRQGPEIYKTYDGLIIGVECECATAAVVGATLGLEIGALLFCTDNVTLAKSEDQVYRGLASEAVRGGFEAGLELVVDLLA